MQELISIGTNIATLIAIAVAAVSGIVIAFAGFQYATAAGDPQKVGLAKNSFVGAFIGLIIASLAFIGPRIVTDIVIKPVGGVSLDMDAGLSCDSVLRNQLVFQRGASTAERINVVISQIQAQQTDCASEVWDPDAIDMTTGGSVGKCFSFTAGTASTAASKIGTSDVPDGLKTGATRIVRLGSGRDSKNNILAYWSDTQSNRPSDGASCWLYIARLRTWHENYY